MEIWLPVVGYEGLYEVSNLGNVRSVDRVVSVRNRWGDVSERRYTGKMLTACASGSGHLVVALYRQGVRTTPNVHRLVLAAFVGPCPDGMECCHWDDDPTNNRLENLRWDTPRANQLDAVRNGRNRQAAQTHCVHGHEFTEGNTHVLRRGRRQCRACGRRRARSRRTRLAAA